MSKRFIDTGLFDDDWFMDLSKDAKLLWVYFITKCDHAGILKLNEKLCKLQTGIKDLNEIIIQLGNRLVTVTEHLYFIPKFVEYQYPGFPECNFKAAKSAIDILNKYDLIKEGKLTVSEVLPNTYGKGIGKGKGKGKEEKSDFENFWNLYNKKVGSKDNCKKKWDKLNLTEQQKIIDILPEYLLQFRDRQFQPYPETFLNQKRWENEILKPKNILDQTPVFTLSDEDKKEFNELKKIVYGK